MLAAFEQHVDEIGRRGRMQLRRQAERRPGVDERCGAAGLVAGGAGALIEPCDRRGRGVGGARGLPLDARYQLFGLGLRQGLAQRGKIGRHRPDIGIGQLPQLGDHRRHRTRDRAVMLRGASLQIGIQLRLAPGNRPGRKPGQRRRRPALGLAASEIGAAALLRAERIARRVAGAAMAEPIDEITPAIPLG